MFKNKEYVLTVVKEKSFTSASQKLFVSQPSLSASIKRIEDKIGSPIFNRSSSPISLTEVGVKYVEYANLIEQKENEFKSFLSDNLNLFSGKVKIGGSSLFSSFILPELIADFNKQYPQIKFRIFEDNTKNLLSKLELGEVDVILDNAEVKDGNILSTPYMQENLLLAVPKKFEINEQLKKHRLTAEDIKKDKHLLVKDGIALANFSNLPFVLLNSENDSGKRAETLLKKNKVNYTVLFHLDQQLSAYNVCCAGLALTFIADTLIKKNSSSHDVYYYKIDDPISSRHICFFHKTNRYLSRAAQSFIDFSTNSTIK